LFGNLPGKKKFRYRRQRAFWRFLDKPTVLVIGELVPEVLLGTLDDALKDVVASPQNRQVIIERVMSHLYTQEISGLVGRGDLEAMVRILAKIASMRFWPRPLVVHPSQVHEERKQNLILIGGKDTNSLTSAIAPRIGCRLESLINAEGHNVVHDWKLDVDHPPTPGPVPDGKGGTVRKDYGILARGPNPYNPEREVLLLAGAHGLGSLAAAEVCLSEDFEKRLHNDLLQFNGSFECLVSYKRVDGGQDDGNMASELEMERGLQSPQANG
jgi:hypothetical protein